MTSTSRRGPAPQGTTRRSQNNRGGLVGEGEAGHLIGSGTVVSPAAQSKDRWGDGRGIQQSRGGHSSEDKINVSHLKPRSRWTRLYHDYDTQSNPFIERRLRIQPYEPLRRTITVVLLYYRIIVSSFRESCSAVRSSHLPIVSLSTTNTVDYWISVFI